MYRNQYDTDVTTFSPVGRLHQLEYAIEAVKQGSGVVGVRSKDTVVLVSLKRSPSELASYQKKIFRVDDHMGIGVSGLIADARMLRKYMIEECLNHKWSFSTPLPVGRLVVQLSDKAQYYTQRSEKRPYGVGLLVAGYDQTGPHLYQTDPSGNFNEYVAHAMGARSQSSKTYLEKHFESFEEMKLDDLIFHALNALKGSSQDRLSTKNVSIAFVGENFPFTVLEDEQVRPHVEKLSQDDIDDKKRTIFDDEDDKKDDDDDGKKKDDGKEQEDME